MFSHVLDSTCTNTRSIVSLSVFGTSNESSCETSLRAKLHSEGDKAPAHGGLASLRRMHCGHSLRRLLASVSPGGGSNRSGAGRVRGPRDEQGALSTVVTYSGFHPDKSESAFFNSAFSSRCPN